MAQREARERQGEEKNGAGRRLRSEQPGLEGRDQRMEDEEEQVLAGEEEVGGENRGKEALTSVSILAAKNRHEGAARPKKKKETSG